jgi:hypothetical protein
VRSARCCDTSSKRIQTPWGTELDPAALRARRDKLIARPKSWQQPVVTAESGDLAAQLGRRCGRTRSAIWFSGRNPVEVIDDLRAQ